MRSAHITNMIRAGTKNGSGDTAAPGAGHWLGLAAAPTFLVMALWTALSRGQSEMPGMVTQDWSSLAGMTLMYALMSIFHLSPWLKLISGYRNDTRGEYRVKPTNSISSICS